MLLEINWHNTFFYPKFNLFKLYHKFLKNYSKKVSSIKFNMNNNNRQTFLFYNIIGVEDVSKTKYIKLFRSG